MPKSFLFDDTTEIMELMKWQKKYKSDEEDVYQNVV